MKFYKEIELKDYLSIIWRRKWFIISFFLITVTAVSLATFIQKEVYRATATVIIDAETPNILSVKDVVKLGEADYLAYRDYIETQQEIIRSRRTAHYVMKNLALQNRYEFRKAKDPIETLLKKLHVDLVRDTRILKIHVDDRDPVLASRIANEFAKVYAESNIALKMKISKEAQSWLKDEVEKQKRKVRKSELNLQSYKERNDIISIKNQESIINDSIAKLNTSFLDAQKRRIKAETIYNSLIDSEGKMRLENLPPLIINNKTLQQLKNEYLKRETLLVEYKKIYKDKHPRMIRLVESIEYLKSRIKDEIETEYKSAVEEEGKFKEALEAGKKKALELERKIINYNALKRELDTNERMLQIVLNRLKETSISSQILTNNVRVQDLSEVPKKPIRPRKLLNIILSAIVGLAGGIFIAFFKESMDATLKDPNEIAEYLQLPLLGAVPRIRLNKHNIKNREDIDMVVEKDSHSLAAEAYRMIRTNLLFSINHSSSAKTIVVTSALPREGKTLTAVNLAIMIAQSGERVLLVDADMRKPRIHEIFAEENQSGLSQFLTGDKDFESIVKYSGIENLNIVTSGKITDRPAELISSENMKLFLEKATERFSKIIFDTPPVIVVTDAQILSSICTGVVLITEEGKTTKHILQRSKELLEKVDARILGVIMNNTSLTKSNYSYPQYYYGKYYTQTQTE